ncbi:hypothetical protein FXO38_19849 [Capsicum annuum]|nr:hypothetical protein FXO38_19849 [Capsicum annuum]
MLVAMSAIDWIERGYDDFVDPSFLYELSNGAFEIMRPVSWRGMPPDYLSNTLPLSYGQLFSFARASHITSFLPWPRRTALGCITCAESLWETTSLSLRGSGRLPVQQSLGSNPVFVLRTLVHIYNNPSTANKQNPEFASGDKLWSRMHKLNPGSALGVKLCRSHVFAMEPLHKRTNSTSSSRISTTGNFYIWMGYDSTTDGYKVLKTDVDRNDGCKVSSEILSLKNDSWSKIDEHPSGRCFAFHDSFKALRILYENSESEASPFALIVLEE